MAVSHANWTFKWYNFYLLILKVVFLLQSFLVITVLPIVLDQKRLISKLDESNLNQKENKMNKLETNRSETNGLETNGLETNGLETNKIEESSKAVNSVVS